MLPFANMPFEFAVVELHLSLKGTVEFNTWPGFIIRSGFGAALKKLCIYKSRRVPCTECRLLDSCPYAYIFETYRPGDRDIDFTAENFPHPFVFSPSVTEPGSLSSGDPLAIRLTLFGRGINYLLFYIYAFDLLGDMGLGKSRGRYRLERVVDHFSGRTLYTAEDKTLRGEPQRQTLADLQHAPNGDSVQLDFVCPTKIEQHNRTVDRLTPDILIRSLLRRASLLAELHQQKKWQLDFRGLIEQFNSSVDSFRSNISTDRFDRYSVRQGRKQPHFAFTGSFSMTGELSEFMPLIRLGEFMHIGKSSSMGFGKYRITEGKS